MSRFSSVIAISCALTVSACGTIAQNSDVGPLHTGIGDAPVIADRTDIQIVDSGPAPTSDAQNVSGYSCKNKIWEAPPSRENAINLMKEQAKSRGFTRVHSVQVEDDPAPTLKNCWAGITATGVAFNPAQPAPAVPPKKSAKK